MDGNNLQQKPVIKKLNTVRTFSSDMAQATKGNNVSVISVAVAEQKKREKEEVYEKAKVTPMKKFIWITLGTLLILLGLGLYYVVFMRKTTETVPVIQTPSAIEAPIPYDDTVHIDITNTISGVDISKLIYGEILKTTSVHKIKDLLIYKTVSNVPQPVHATDFVNQIGSSMPDSLARSLTDSYMVGTYASEAGAPHLFLIFKTNDYNIAYASMLSWENTMLGDFFSMFGIDVSGDKKERLDEKWNDIIIENKDARVLYDSAHNPILYYAFLDKADCIITDDPSIIKEVASRLITKNIKPL